MEIIFAIFRLKVLKLLKFELFLSLEIGEKLKCNFGSDLINFRPKVRLQILNFEEFCH